MVKLEGAPVRRSEGVLEEKQLSQCQKRTAVFSLRKFYPSTVRLTLRLNEGLAPALFYFLIVTYMCECLYCVDTTSAPTPSPSSHMPSPPPSRPFSSVSHLLASLRCYIYVYVCVYVLLSHSLLLFSSLFLHIYIYIYIYMTFFVYIYICIYIYIWIYI